MRGAGAPSDPGGWQAVARGRTTTWDARGRPQPEGSAHGPEPRFVPCFFGSSENTCIFFQSYSNFAHEEYTVIT